MSPESGNRFRWNLREYPVVRRFGRTFEKTTLLIFVTFALNNCAPAPDEEEKSRIKSPDSIVDVVVTEVKAGATAANPTKIYIVPTGAKFSGENFVLLADRFEIETVEWVGPKQLGISFHSGRIFEYSNFWQSRDVQNFQYIVQIYLTDTNTPR
jgi:hypothetical protein